MVRRRYPVWLALSLALAIAACGDEKRRAEPPPRAVVTIVQDDAELLFRTPERIGATLDDLKALGVDWVRITAGWSGAQPTRDAPLNLAALDQAVAMAEERGLKLNIDIAFFEPDWAQGPEDYADFAEAVARRYPQAAAFTVWNEPNLHTFFSPQWKRRAGEWVPASPHRYREWLYAAVPRIREAAPDALVLIGATSSLGETQAVTADTRMAPLAFIRELACLRRTPECRDFKPLPGDGWSHHPYTSELRPWESDPEPETARLGDLGRLRSLLDHIYANGRSEEPLPLYLTEYGHQTNPPDPTWATTLAQQARWLAEAEEIARKEPTVRSVAQFLVRDLPERPGPDARTRWRDYQSGLRFEDGRAKPAHAAFALPLVAHETGPDEVRFWGLVRTGPTAVRVTADGRTLFKLRTRPDGTFERTVATDPSARFRLHAGPRTGASTLARSP